MATVINGIYKKALGVDLNLTTDEALYRTVFSPSGEKANLRTNNNMLIKGAYTLYGGRYVPKTTAVPTRTQLVREEMLIAGDIIISSSDNIGSECSVYIVTEGGRLLEMSSTGAQILTISKSDDVMEAILASHSFAVLRPSLSF
jgi:hypothetical protein